MAGVRGCADRMGKGDWPLEVGGSIHPIPGLEANYSASIGWMLRTVDRRMWFLKNEGGRARTKKVSRVNLQTGKMEQWKTFGEEKGAGVSTVVAASSFKRRERIRVSLLADSVGGVRGDGIEVMELGKVLVVFGAVLVVVGIVVMVLGRMNFPLGRLPGDFLYRGKNTTIYFPLVTSVVVSVVLLVLLYVVSAMVVRRFLRYLLARNHDGAGSPPPRSQVGLAPRLIGIEQDRIPSTF